MNSEIFEKLSPNKLLFRCAIPSMITMVFGSLYQIADGLFVGRFIGEDALAAVNLVMPIIMMIFAFSNMIATGASVRIGILLGEKKRKEASNIFSFTIMFIFIISCILGIFGFLFAEWFVRLLAPKATEEAINYGTIYIKVYALFSPLLPLYFVTDNFLRVCGKEKLSMWIGIITQLGNIILDIILIAILKQGIWAAAFTSSLAMAIGSIITLLIFRKKRMDLYYTKCKISLKTFFTIMANGSSEFLSNSAMSIMSLVFNFFLLKYGGTTAVAAFSVIMYVDSIVGMLVFGICDALQPAISHCYGARLHKKLKAIFKRILLCASVLSGLSLLFMRFLGQYVAPFFVKPEDTELLVVSIVGMKIFAFSYLTGWIDMCFSSYFTAIEKPVRSLLTSLFGTLVFPIGCLFLLTPFLNLNGVWISIVVSNFFSALLTIILAIGIKKDNYVLK